MWIRRGSPLCSAKARGQQVQQHRRVVQQIAPAEPAGVGAQPVQPFQPGAAHPARRAGRGAGLKFQRGADAQADPPALRLQRDGKGQQFLQRRAERDEGERGGGAHREIPRAAKPQIIVEQIARRRVVQKIHPRIRRPQFRQIGRIQPDDGGILPVQRRQQRLRDIGAGRHRRGVQAKAAGDVFQHLRIQQAHPGGIIDHPQPRLAFQPGQMVGIRRHDIGEARLRPAHQHCLQHVIDVKIIESQPEKIDRFHEKLRYGVKTALNETMCSLAARRKFACRSLNA